MTEPLRITLEVSCGLDHAFDTWTTHIDQWWPADHTVSGRADSTIVLEPGIGGRIIERTTDGVEHHWGSVTAWEPPTRLAYEWHIGRTPAVATVVDVRFRAVAAARTAVDIEHTGWERLGAEADTWRTRNQHGWDTLLPHFVAAIDHPDTSHEGDH
jgi:uncharacterized protein YndB with AHSA1/START domain